MKDFLLTLLIGGVFTGGLIMGSKLKVKTITESDFFIYDELVYSCDKVGFEND